jgi:hypothetical protein
VTWARFDDSLLLNPKIEPLSDAAWALWSKAIIWSRQQRTDGFVPDAMISRLCKSTRPQAAVRELLEARRRPGVGSGLFDRTDGGFQIHDFDDFGPPVQASAAVSEARKAAGKAGGLRSAQARAASKPASKVEATCLEQTKQTESDGQATVKQLGEAKPSSRADACGRPDPVPSRPVVEEDAGARPTGTVAAETQPETETRPETSQPSRPTHPDPLRDALLATLWLSPDLRAEAPDWQRAADRLASYWPNVTPHLQRVIDATEQAIAELERSRIGKPAPPNANAIGLILKRVPDLIRPGALERAQSDRRSDPGDRRSEQPEITADEYCAMVREIGDDEANPKLRSVWIRDRLPALRRERSGL